MKITYDKQADAMYIYFKKGKWSGTIEVGKNLIIDQDRNGAVLGLEILNASKSFGKRPEVTVGKQALSLLKYA